MRHDPASGAIIIMLRSLKMYGMAQSQARIPATPRLPVGKVGSLVRIQLRHRRQLRWAGLCPRQGPRSSTTRPRARHAARATIRPFVRGRELLRCKRCSDPTFLLNR
jgi:hypothetical protein